MLLLGNPQFKHAVTPETRFKPWMRQVGIAEKRPRTNMQRARSRPYRAETLLMRDARVGFDGSQTSVVTLLPIDGTAHSDEPLR